MDTTGGGRGKPLPYDTKPRALVVPRAVGAALAPPASLDGHDRGAGGASPSPTTRYREPSSAFLRVGYFNAARNSFATSSGRRLSWSWWAVGFVIVSSENF